MVSHWSSVCLSIHPSIDLSYVRLPVHLYFHFRTILSSKYQTSGLGLLMGKFSQFLTELSARRMVVVEYYRFMFWTQLFKANDIVS